MKYCSKYDASRQAYSPEKEKADWVYAQSAFPFIRSFFFPMKKTINSLARSIVANMTGYVKYIYLEKKKPIERERNRRFQRS